MSSPQHVLVSASAGSGKTYKLMNEVFEEVKAGMPPHGLIASTFTIKAAGELKERIRQKLIDGGLVEQSRAMELALVGTVHSVCAEILRRFAFEQGASLRQEILVDDEKTRLFRQSLNECMSEQDYAKFSGFAHRFSILIENLEEHIEDLVDLARQNDFDEQGWKNSIEASLKILIEAIPQANRPDCTQELKAALRHYLTNHPVPPSPHANTAVAHETVKQAARILEQGGELTWREWVLLGKLGPAVQVLPLFRPVIDSARLFLATQEFRSDLEESVRFVFGLAKKAMDHYSGKKKALGRLDFSDLEQMTLKILDQPEVIERLRSELHMLMVDEFQDTNPVQLAIFMKLGALCKKVVWVGDLKQSIYGFRGSDPTLMEMTMKAVLETSLHAVREVLPSNWRSAKGIVEFNNEVFVRAFARDGIPASEIRQDPKWPHTSDEQTIEVWNSHEKNKSQHAKGLASGVRSLLNSGVIRPGDIALLLRTKDHVDTFTKALKEAGLSVSVSGGELLKQSEVVLALAAYRYLVNPRDSVAAGELLLGFGIDPNEWLKRALARETAHPVLEKLEEARKLAKGLGVCEKLDLAIAVSGLPERLSSMSGGDQREFHVAALRQVAIRYEDQCLASFTPCSDTGFLAFLDEEEPEIPASEHSGAIHVMTYHKAKGLEWPVVILGSLKSDPVESSLFDSMVRLEPHAKFDFSAPLANRVIENLLWPFGKQKKIDNLTQHQVGSKSLTERQAARRAEHRRLLYVGMTRAKERLVFLNEYRNALDESSFLGVLEGEEGFLVSFSPEAGKILIDGAPHPCRTVELDPAPAPASSTDPSTTRKVRVLPEGTPLTGDQPSLYLQPSALSWSAIAEEGATRPALLEVMAFGRDLVLNRSAQQAESSANAPSRVRRDELGTAVHLFLGSDDSRANRRDRVMRAEDILKRFSVRANVVSAEALVEASDRFFAKVKEIWPRGELHREVPVQFELKGSIVRGSMDALVLTAEEAVIVDHKASLKRVENASELLDEYGPQLLAYATAVRRAYPGRKVRAFLHNPDGWIAEAGV